MLPLALNFPDSLMERPLVEGRAIAGGQSRLDREGSAALVLQIGSGSGSGRKGGVAGKCGRA